MKILSVAVLSSTLLAAPAAASVAHQTSLTHEGQTISVSYEPVTKMSLRQTGIGPRNQAQCIWKTEVSVERKLIDASGRPIEALVRTVGEPKVSQGLANGYCAQLTPSQIATIEGDSGRMQNLLVRAAENDRPTLHTELASLGSLRRAASR